MENRAEKYIIFELLEKIYRLKKFIGTHKIILKEKGKITSEVFEKAIKNIYSNLEYPILALKHGSNDFTYEERISINRRLSTTFHVLREFHSKLKYIYSDWVRPETYTFTKRLFQNLPINHSEIKVNIILSDEYTFKENNLINKFNEIFKNSRIDNISENINYATFFLPKIESCNPLNWAILAHEIAHVNETEIKSFIDNKLLIPLDTNTENKDILKKWAEEIYCDIFAINLLGPAYFASFVSFALATSGLGGNSKNSFSHPSNMLRIRFLHEHLTRNKSNLEINSDKLGDFEMNAFFHKLIEDFDKVDRKSGTNFLSNGFNIDNLTYFTDFIREKSKDFVIGLKIEDTELRIINSLSDRLKRGITIGSYHDDNYEKILIDLNTGAKDFDIIKKAISERGTSIREILNAGWVNKISNYFPYIMELIFSDKRINIPNYIEIIGNLIEESDDRLLKSIESSELFYIIEND